MVDPANARHGDAVYSQEALDRIISNLMEANPQSNAAPPATEDAMAKLERKKMDETMRTKEGGKVECTVCIDEVKIGDEVIFLPCKHWFHEACVTMWLKEHNTCPICRTPIEAGGGNGTGNRNSRPSAQQQGQGQGPGAGPSAQQGPASGGPAPGPGPPPFRGRAFGFPIFFEPRRPEAGDAQARNNFPGTSGFPGSFPGTSGDRENRWPNVGSRRSSVSPPPNASDAGSRTRDRSPSTNSRRSTPAGEQEQQREGSRPLRWLQDRFGGRSDRRQP
ncbi:MAG: hypothetical protein IMZ46_13550 [Acidobacteria bacterium]|nr:hypothetical protein [Acidobacteriota bacterium]